MNLLSDTRSDSLGVIFVHPGGNTTVLVDFFRLGKCGLSGLGEFTRDGLVLANDLGSDSEV